MTTASSRRTLRVRKVSAAAFFDLDKRMPRWHPISISGYHIREAGSTAAQELAFTLKDGFTYVERAIDRGLEIDAFAPRLSFFFTSHRRSRCRPRRPCGSRCAPSR